RGRQPAGGAGGGHRLRDQQPAGGRALPPRDPHGRRARQLRRHRGPQAAAARARGCHPGVILVAVDPEAHLASSFSPLGRFGDDLIERFDGRTLVRALRRGTVGRAFACTIVPGGLEVQASAGLELEQATRAVRRTLLDGRAVLAPLAAGDPVVARLLALHPGFRVLLDSDPLAGLVRAVSAQQINLAFAARVRRRLAERYGEWQTAGEHGTYVLSPERLAAADPADLRVLQFTLRKGETIVALAQAVVDGRLALDRLAGE